MKWTKGALLAAAVSGVLSGTCSCDKGNAGAPAPSSTGVVGPASSAKHSCKGQNDCKGQGGCRTEAHGCKGKNACKGQGGCNMT